MFDDWFDAQHYAYQLLQEGVEFVKVEQFNYYHNEYGIIQELNLERGVKPNPHWNTWTFAPYFWKTLWLTLPTT